nr:hypothetical protein CFP56_60579 [Quercus suber]
MEEERLVDICIARISLEYHPYLDNLQIPSFTRLVNDARIIIKELYSILDAWVKDGVVVLLECKREPERRKSEVAKGDLVIKNGKRVDQRMHILEIAMKSFIGYEDLMKDEAVSATNSSFTPPPMQDEKMALRIQQNDKVHSFLEGIGLRP